MGGGVSKRQVEVLRKELETRDTTIKRLENALEQLSKQAPGELQVRQVSTTDMDKVPELKLLQISGTDLPRHSMAKVKPKLPSVPSIPVAIEPRGTCVTNPVINTARRLEVSAEVMKSSNPPIVRKIYPKDESSKQIIISVLQSNILFVGLSKEELQDTLDSFLPVEYTAGSIVIRQGDQGDNFYAVEAGQLNVLVAVNGEASSIRYGTLSTGMGFGELALLYNMPRAATIQANTDVKLWTLERQVFREIVASHKAERLQQALNILRKVDILAKLTQKELLQMATAMEWEQYTPGTNIINEGEVGERFYICTKGKILVHQKDDNGKSVHIRYMEAGAYFGEMALIKDETRSATCTAQCDSQCLTLDREHFIGMLGTLQELMDRLPARKGTSNSSQQKRRFENNLANYKYYKQINKEELDILQTIGRGAFGRVKLVRRRGTDATFALKCLSKQRIVDNNLTEHVLNERRVMLSLDHPFILKLFSTYKDETHLYFLLEIALGGELFTYLQRCGHLDDANSQFFIASIVLVLEHMHSKSIAYRDLKPENILLDEEGFVKLADFGLAKLVTDRTWTLCGTPDYLAPEIILNNGHDKAVDYWALGILIYELRAGCAPFFAADPMQIYALIINGRPKFPPSFSRTCEDLVMRLLCQNPARRLGNMKNGLKDIINHKWFSRFPWEDLLRKNIKPPFIPQIRDSFDTSNFENFQNDMEEPQPCCNWDPDF